MPGKSRRPKGCKLGARIQPSQHIVNTQIFRTVAVSGMLGETAYHGSSLGEFSRVCGLTMLVLRHLPLGSVHNDRAQKMWASTARRNRRIARPATISTRPERSRLVTTHFTRLPIPPTDDRT